MYDLLVIGGGPAGVGAAGYALHLGLTTLLISPDLGGKVNSRFTICDMPYAEMLHGTELLRTYAAKVAPDFYLPELVTLIEEVPGGFRVLLPHQVTFEGRALVIATGAKPRQLYVQGAGEYWGRGLSYSALSHSYMLAGRDTAVIGNDHRAQVAALELARVARTVSLIAPYSELLEPVLIWRLLEHSNVHLYKGWKVLAIEGQSGYVATVIIQGHDGYSRQIPVDGVFVELGLVPSSNLVSHLVARDAEGYIKIDQRATTSHPAIFAAGDVTNIPGEQVPIALGEGLKAAISASEYLARLEPLEGQHPFHKTQPNY